jgi:hypothetical protein
MTSSPLDCFTDISRARISKEEFLKRAGVDTVNIDYSLPQSFYEECRAKKDEEVYVWDYRNNTTFGEPLCFKDIYPALESKLTEAISAFNVEPTVKGMTAIYRLTSCLPLLQVRALLTGIQPNGLAFLSSRLSGSK